MISIIIPTFNRAVFLKKAIESVVSQAYKDFELIVVDDGSEDETSKIVTDFRDKRIKYIRQSNEGVSCSRNLGIKNSKRNFIAFLDSDDWWDKNKLELQLKTMQKNPEYFISHTDEIWYKNGKLLNQKKKHKKSPGYIFDKCLSLCSVSMSTVMIKRELFDRVGLFDENFPCCEDYDFWLRVSARFQFLLIDKPLTLKDGGRPDQVSSIYAQGIDRFRIESIVKILESGALSVEQKKLAARELQKKCLIYGNGAMKHGKKEEGEYYLKLAERYIEDKVIVKIPFL